MHCTVKAKKAGVFFSLSTARPIKLVVSIFSNVVVWFSIIKQDFAKELIN
jgi:hypothetical protein